MSDMTIEEFCNQHKACDDGREWALENCTSMPDAWKKIRPDWLIWVATRSGVLSKNDLQRFAIYCARSVEHLLTDDRLRNAINVVERYINGEATGEELHAAMAAAMDAGAAARAAASEAAWAASDAASAAASAAARAAASEAARAAASAAASEAARDAASEAARDAAWAAAWNGQAKFIRESMIPNFARIKEAGDE